MTNNQVTIRQKYLLKLLDKIRYNKNRGFGFEKYIKFFIMEVKSENPYIQ